MLIIIRLSCFIPLLPFISVAQTDVFSDMMNQALRLEDVNPDSAIFIYEEVRKQAQLQDASEVATQALYNQGIVYMKVGDFDTCGVLLDMAYEEYEELSNPIQLTKAQIAIANNYYFQSKYEKALTNYQKALDKAVGLDDPLMQARILSNQSSIFNVTNRIESALGCLRQARSLAEPLGSSVFLADIYNNFSVNFQSLFIYDSASHYAQKAANIYGAFNNDLYQALALTNLSAYLHEHKPPKLEESKIVLDKSRTILDTMVAPGIEINYWKHLAYYHFKKEEYELAKQYSFTCLKHIEGHPDLPSERNIYEFLYGIFKMQGQIDSSLKYHEKYTEARDTLIFQQSRKQLQDLQARYQSVKKDEELAQQNLIINKRTSERNLFLLCLLITALLSWFLIDRYKKNKKLQSEKINNLEQYQKILVMDSMLQGQEEERKRIAQDLHDGLGTLLVSARIQVQNAQRLLSKLNEKTLFNNTENLIDNACKEVRRIAHDMMPSALVDLGFVDAVDDLVTEIRSQNSIAIDFNAPPMIPPLENAMALNLYRIVQEIMQNIVKHAQANIVAINLILERKNSLIIEISDDGIGFDPGQINQGIGLTNIASRVEYLNGNLKLESKPDEGCTYSIQIPIDISEKPI